MDIPLNRNSKEPLFHQIYRYYADAIEAGTLKQDSKLPSVRKLSEGCAVSLMTAMKAYRLLEENGFTYALPGKGVFAQSFEIPKLKPDISREQDSYHLHQRFPWKSAHGKPRIPEGYQKDLSDLSIDSELFPLQNISNMLLKAAVSDPASYYQKGSPFGDDLLRRAMGVFFQTRNITVDAQELLLCDSVDHAFALIVEAFLTPGDTVVLESPTSPWMIQCLRKHDIQILPVPVDSEGISLESLEALLKDQQPKMVWIHPDFQNPTGTVLSNRRRQRLIALAKVHQFLIVEYDPWSELCHQVPCPPAVKSIDATGHVLYVKTFSVSLLPGCPLTAMAADPYFLNALKQEQIHKNCSVSKITETLYLPLMQPPFIHGYLTQLNHLLHVRGKQVHDQLSQKLTSKVHWGSFQGGTGLWLTLPSQYSAQTLQHLLDPYQIKIGNGAEFFPTSRETNHFQIAMGKLDSETLTATIDQLCQTINQWIDKNA